MKRSLGLNKYMAVVLALALVWNMCSYYGARLIADGRYHFDFSLPADASVPFLPWTLCLYVSAFFFWCANYYISARQEREASDRFFCADFLGKVICFLCFILLPTANIRPEITQDNVWGSLLSIIYRLDEPNNLFPSIHCFASWLCWAGVRGRRDLSKGYHRFSLFLAVAICCSTLTTRQHVLADVISGIALGEACFRLAGHARIRCFYTGLINAIMRSI